MPNDDDEQTMLSTYCFRFVYFDVRGAGELCRYVLACSGADWEDVRYPMKLAAGGFSLGHEFRRDAAAGGFDCNMGNLPVLQVTDLTKTKAYATVGQSHAIARFVARTHGLMGEGGDLDELKVDAVYECCRDIKTAWYRRKREPNGKMAWFGGKNLVQVGGGGGGGDYDDDDNDDGDDIDTLPYRCRQLEKVLVSTRFNKQQQPSSSDWCLNTPNPTLADIAIYHLLGTPISTLSGSTVSFFDGEKELVEKAFKEDCPLLSKSVQATGNLKAIKEWEAKRPDTFS